MHFTTLFVLKNETLDDIGSWDIEQMFGQRFCYSCGESKPMYQYWCDWFQIGGRWADILHATNGIYGEQSFFGDGKTTKGCYSIVEIKDLTEPINESQIYAIATKSRIYQKSSDWQIGGNYAPDKFDKLLDDINNKRFNGVIALIDCHD